MNLSLADILFRKRNILSASEYLARRFFPSVLSKCLNSSYIVGNIFSVISLIMGSTDSKNAFFSLLKMPMILEARIGSNAFNKIGSSFVKVSKVKDHTKLIMMVFHI